MTKQEIEQNYRVLYLNIKQNFFDEIIAGTKTQEFREVKPTTIKKLLQIDEDGFELQDECGNSLPIHYDVIHFRVGMNTVADEAYVRVKDAQSEVLVDENEQPFAYVTDEKGHTLVDEEGYPIAPIFDEENNCTNGLYWVVQRVVYDLGEILWRNDPSCPNLTASLCGGLKAKAKKNEL